MTPLPPPPVDARMDYSRMPIGRLGVPLQGMAANKAIRVQERALQGAPKRYTPFQPVPTEIRLGDKPSAELARLAEKEDALTKRLLLLELGRERDAELAWLDEHVATKRWEERKNMAEELELVRAAMGLEAARCARAAQQQLGSVPEEAPTSFASKLAEDLMRSINVVLEGEAPMVQPERSGSLMGTPVTEEAAERASSPVPRGTGSRSPEPSRRPEDKAKSRPVEGSAPADLRNEFDTPATSKPDVQAATSSKPRSATPARAMWYQTIDGPEPARKATVERPTGEGKKPRGASAPGAATSAKQPPTATTTSTTSCVRSTGNLSADFNAAAAAAAGGSTIAPSVSAPTTVSKKRNPGFLRRSTPLAPKGRVTGSPTGRSHSNPERRKDIRGTDMITNIDWVMAKPEDVVNGCTCKEASWVPSQAWFESLRYYPSGKEAVTYGDSDVTFSGNTHGPHNQPQHLETDVRTRLGLAVADPDWTDEQLPFYWAPNVGAHLGRRNRRRPKAKSTEAGGGGPSESDPDASPPPPKPKTRAQEALEAHAARLKKKKEQQESSPYVGKPPPKPAKRGEKGTGASSSAPPTMVIATKSISGSIGPMEA